MALLLFLLHHKKMQENRLIGEYLEPTFFPFEIREVHLMSWCWWWTIIESSEFHLKHSSRELLGERQEKLRESIGGCSEPMRSEVLVLCCLLSSISLWMRRKRGWNSIQTRFTGSPSFIGWAIPGKGNWNQSRGRSRHRNNDNGCEEEKIRLRRRRRWVVLCCVLFER